MRDEVLNDAKPEASFQFATAKHTEGFIVQAQKPVGVVEKLLPGLGESHLATVPRKQLCPQKILKPLDPGAHS
ncbi:hypothetical protein GmRootA79_37350 [Acidovorax sp. A79]